jgi:hypothetical protein
VAFALLTGITQTGRSVLTDTSVRFLRFVETSVSRIWKPIGLSQEKEPTKFDVGSTVRFSVETKETEHREERGRRNSATSDASPAMTAEEARPQETTAATPPAPGATAEEAGAHHP